MVIVRIKIPTSEGPVRHTNLVAEFDSAKDVYSGSEAYRHNPLSSDQSSDVLTSEDSPYGCDETIHSIGRRHWGYKPRADDQSLEDVIVDLLPLPIQDSARRHLPWHSVDKVAEAIGEAGLFNPDVLAVFRSLGLSALSLTASLQPDMIGITRLNPYNTLRVFQAPHAFRSLEILVLRNISLKNEHVACLSNLRISQLDLSGTGISSEATAHLVALKKRLVWLDLSRNPRIKHCSCHNLACLSNLNKLDLSETRIGMVSLRYIAEKYAESHGLYQDFEIAVPDNCRRYLRDLSSIYHLNITDQYIGRDNLKRLKSMNISAIKRNLEWHKIKLPSLRLDGNIEELCDRLKRHLKRREADFRLKRWANITTA